MKKYRRVHMPEPLHKQIKRFVKKSREYKSVDQVCREATEAIIKEHRLTKYKNLGGKSKTKQKSANIPEENYLKIQTWIKTGKTPYISVDEAVRDAIRRTL